jgi:proteasome lid subunit RPN8/RPN11
MTAKVVIKKELLDVILEGAQRLYPKEYILLLRGKMSREDVTISDVLIPPLATYGKGFSGFPTSMLPMDFSIIGVAHSHPSGSLEPSVQDRNLPMGRIMLIAAFPYRGRENVAVYSRKEGRLSLEVTDL